MGVFVGISAIYHIIGGHNGFCAAFLYGNFKAGEINLPQSALVQYRVGSHPLQLLGVDGKMLGAGGNAHLLDAADIGGGHLACKDGIFGEIFKVSAAEGTALDVQSGA